MPVAVGPRPYRRQCICSKMRDVTPELGADKAAGARKLSDPDRAAILGHHFIDVSLHAWLLALGVTRSDRNGNITLSMLELWNTAA